MPLIFNGISHLLRHHKKYKHGRPRPIAIIISLNFSLKVSLHLLPPDSDFLDDIRIPKSKLLPDRVQLAHEHQTF